MKTRNRPIFIILLVVLFLVMALGIHPSAMAISTPAPNTQTSTQLRSFDDLPPGLAPAVARALQKEIPPIYHMSRQGKDFQASNPAHGMSFTFTQEGPKVQDVNGAWQWGMSLKRYGYAGSELRAPVAHLSGHRGRMEYQRGPTLTEWYLNTTWGMEQGFAIASAPAPCPPGENLVLEMTLSGPLQPRLQGNTLLLRDAKGKAIARYTGLYAYDTEGKSLPSRLSLKGDTLRILIDDSTARYPITIDPWLQQAKLTASDGAAYDLFGLSVSINGDTVVVGSYADDDNGSSSGSAYVFERTGGIWTQTAKLKAGDDTAGDYFGRSVSISGDTVVVGAYKDDDNGSNSGSAYVFEKPPGGWADMTQTAKLKASDGAVSDYFGTSVSISGDTVVVGADCDDDNRRSSGSAYVFEKPPGGWADMTQTAKLTASDGAAYDYFGRSVSISGDTVVVGALYDDNNSIADPGSAYVFEKPPGGWADMTQTAKLTASDGAADDHFGNSVSISGDTVVVGAQRDDDNGIADAGSAYVFERPPGGWADMTQTAKLKASDGAADDDFGSSVAISGDTVVVGADCDNIGGNSYQGSAYVFKLTPSLAPVLMLLLED